jgi:hypothetical protein
MDDGSYKCVVNTEWKRKKYDLTHAIDELKNLTKDIAIGIKSRSHRIRTCNKCIENRQQIFIKILKNITQQIESNLTLDGVLINQWK